MFSAKQLVLAALVALGALVAYGMYGDYQKRAQQKAIAGKEAARADDLGPAIVGNKPLAQQHVGITR